MEQTAAAAAYKRNIARERQHTWPHCVPPTLLTGNLAGHRAPPVTTPLPLPPCLPACGRTHPCCRRLRSLSIHHLSIRLSSTLYSSIHPLHARSGCPPPSSICTKLLTFCGPGERERESTDDGDQCPTGMMSSTLLLELKGVHLCQ